ncbi:TonB-dependent receptor domain-containing protein [Parvicella tangerina]|nr:TonB-dependent receptor [Parvicella tangerina]
MRIFFVLIGVLVGVQLIAQKGQLSGRVMDKQSDEAMLYVTVSLHNLTDTSLVTGGITDMEGKFKITDVPVGDKYLFKCSFIGYGTQYIAVDFTNKKSIDLGDVVMAPGTNELDGVDVTVDRPTVTYEIDKKVVNVENMNTVASQTAVEVLANIPSISVDMDGNISLRGSAGFTLLIDGRPSALPPSDALQMIQASNIKDIEIITNPSAKYDAEGTSGIINVILKKNKLEGVSTLINVSGGNSGYTSEYWNYNGDFLTSINKGKFKFNIGGQFVNRNRFRDIEQERITTIGSDESKIESSGLHRFFGKNFGGNAAMEYAPNDNNVLSVGLDVRQRQWNAAAKYDFDEYSNDTLVSAYRNDERTLRNFFVVSGSLGYQHLFQENKDHYLSLTSTYNLYDGEEDAQTEFYTTEGVYQGGNRNTEVGPSNAIRVSLDYQYPFKNKMKLQVGARGDFGFSGDDQDSYAYSFAEEEYVRLDSFSTDVAYAQNVYAGYTILNGKIKEKLGYQVGLRAEYTDRFIELTNSTQNTSIQRLDWFPSAHFSYELDEKNQFKASASRRINRPRSWHLEPFIAWEDPYTVRQGNPNLLPEYIQSYELGYIRELEKGSFSTELYFRNTNNIRERIQEVYDTNVIIKRPVNAGVSQALGAELAFNKKLFKWWSLDVGANLFYYKITGQIPGSSLDQESFSYRARLANSFILPNDWKVQLITLHESDVVSVQGVDKGFTSVDLAIKKDFLERKVSATLQFQNMLATQRRETWVDTETLYSYRLATPKYPVITLAVSVRLNNFNNQDKIRTEQGSEF